MKRRTVLGLLLTAIIPLRWQRERTWVNGEIRLMPVGYARTPAERRSAFARALKYEMDRAEQHWQEHGKAEFNRIVF